MKDLRVETGDSRFRKIESFLKVFRSKRNIGLIPMSIGVEKYAERPLLIRFEFPSTTDQENASFLIMYG